MRRRECLRRDVLPAVAAAVVKADGAAAGAERTALAAESLVGTDLRQLVTTLRQDLIPQVPAVIRSADGTVAATAALERELPPILEKLNATLDTVQAITLDLKRASVQVPALLQDGGTLVQDSEALVKRVGGCRGAERRAVAEGADARRGELSAPEIKRDARPRRGAARGPGGRRSGRPRVVGMLGLGAAAGLLAGCGVPSRSSAGAPRAGDRAQPQGDDGVRAREYETALAGYREALQISRAIEHVDGIAANLLDLAAVPGPRRRGAAAGAVDELLADGKLAFSPAQRSSAAYLRALLYADERPPGGVPAGGAALALCRESACGNEGRIVNLQARIAFLAGDRAAALASAREALALNRKAKADEEKANSLRIAADAHAALGELAQAEAGYAEALSLDKSSASPPRSGSI